MSLERVSVVRMATVKFQGWIHAPLVMGVASLSSIVLNEMRFQKEKPRERSLWFLDTSLYHVRVFKITPCFFVDH